MSHRLKTIEKVQNRDIFGKTASQNLNISNKNSNNTFLGGTVTIVIKVFLFYELMMELTKVFTYGNDSIKKEMIDIDDSTYYLQDLGFMPVYFIYGDHIKQ